MSEDQAEGTPHLGVLASLRSALSLLTRRDRRILSVVVVLQVALSLLDLVAVALIGIVAAVAGTAATGSPPALLGSLIDRLGLADVDPLVLAIVLAAVAGVLLLVKSVLTFLLTRRTFRFLANRQAMISSRLAESLLSRPLLQVQRRSSQEVAYALTRGVNSLTMGVIGQAVILIGESSLIVVLTIGLLFVDPMVAIFAVAFFGALALLLHRTLAGIGSRLGKQAQDAEIDSVESIQEVLRSYREVTVSGRSALHVEEFQGLRWIAAGVQGTLMVVSQISKYAFELALILGGSLLALSQALTKDTAAAVAVIAVFLAASSRIMPSLLRLQDATFAIRGNSALAGRTLELVRQLEDTAEDGERRQRLPKEVLGAVLGGIADDHAGFTPEVVCTALSFRFPDADRATVEGFSVTVRPGTSLALVGATGAGKSTVADLMLGVLEPDSGAVMISGCDPVAAVRRWPGAIAYVPQDVAVANADVRRNVALGLPASAISDDLVWEALRRAHLADLLVDERAGLDTPVGERGIKLSGGQRQRLGLARALYTRPHLLVLDEATSALDAETEAAIAESIAELSGNTTMVLIAHRLATVRDCDQIAYLDDGVALAIGTFDEVRASVPAFDRQAALLGL